MNNSIVLSMDVPLASQRRTCWGGPEFIRCEKLAEYFDENELPACAEHLSGRTP